LPSLLLLLLLYFFSQTLALFASAADLIVAILVVVYRLMFMIPKCIPTFPIDCLWNSKVIGMSPRLF
jgi:hypothetical protein